MKSGTFSQFFLETRPLWTPYQIPQQVSLWLDASVTSSLSLSGSNVTQWNSLLGGVNVVQATGANQPLYSATGFNGRPCVDWGNAVNTRFLQTTSPVTIIQVFFMIRYGTGAYANWQQNNPTVASGELGTTAVSLFVGSGVGTTTWSSVAFLPNCNLNGGTLVSSANLTCFPFPESLWAGYKSSSFTDTFNIGRNNASIGRNWWGPFAEVVCTSTRLTEADRQRVEGYMMWKWGLQANLPVGHPYKNEAPRVA